MNTPIYLDNQSTTALDPRVIKATSRALEQYYGNPSSKTHTQGWIAEELVTIARENVADLIGAKPEEIIFTSGATESNNLALLGFVRSYLRKTKHHPHILSATTEHRAVIDPLKYIGETLAAVEFLDVENDGLISPEKIQTTCKENTKLISLMYGNNEIGVLNDISNISEITRNKDLIFHCDATQAVGKVPVNVNTLGVDLLSFSSHKIYGPKGIGALYIRSLQPRIDLEPIIWGGGQEQGLRSGTLNVPAIVGFGEACRICKQEMSNDKEQISFLTKKLLANIQQNLEGVGLNGTITNRLPGNLNLYFTGVNSAALIGEVSKDISISSSSACSSASKEPSHVLTALRLPKELLLSSLRISVGRFNTEAEIDKASEVLCSAVKKLRA